MVLLTMKSARVAALLLAGAAVSTDAEMSSSDLSRLSDELTELNETMSAFTNTYGGYWSYASTRKQQFDDLDNDEEYVWDYEGNSYEDYVDAFMSPTPAPTAATNDFLSSSSSSSSEDTDDAAPTPAPTTLPASAALLRKLVTEQLVFDSSVCNYKSGDNLEVYDGVCSWPWRYAPANLEPHSENLSYITNEFETFYLIVGGIVGIIMKAGYSMRHSGLCRCKNQFATVMANLFDGMVGALMFYIVGFGWTMGRDDYVESTANGLMGTSLYLHELNHLTEHEDAITWARFIFLFSLCAQSFTIMSGGIMERYTLWGYLTVVAIFAGMAFPSVAHSIWNPGGVFYAARDKNLVFGCGAIDHLGGGAVHMAGGCAALAGNMVLGPRIGRFTGGNDSAGPRKMVDFVQCAPPFVALGGYFVTVFQIGMASYSFDSLEFKESQMRSGIQAAINTVFAAFAGGFTALVGGLIKDGRTVKDRIASIELTIGGMLAACAAVSSGAPFYDQVCAAIVGGGAAIAYIVFGTIVNQLRIDDSASVIAIHFIGGAWGLVAVGVFTDSTHYKHAFDGLIDHNELITGGDIENPRIERCMGIFFGKIGTTGDQLAAQFAYMLWTFAVMLPGMYIVFLIVQEITGLRVDPDMEKDGIDRHFYGGMINSVPQRLNVAMHDKAWTEEPDYDTIQKAQEDDEETATIMSKVKKVQKKVLAQQKMNHEEKQLSYVFKYHNNCLFVRKGDHSQHTKVLSCGKSDGGGVNFHEDELDLDFYVESDLVFYVPQNNYILQNQILAYFMNVHQCGKQRSKQGDGYMMSPAESQMRAKYYWHGMGGDFDTAATTYEKAERQVEKKGSVKRHSMGMPSDMGSINSTLTGDTVIADPGPAFKAFIVTYPSNHSLTHFTRPPTQDDKWAVYAGSFTEPTDT